MQIRFLSMFKGKENLKKDKIINKEAKKNLKRSKNKMMIN